MKKFLLVAVSFVAMFFSAAKIAHASQSGPLNFDVTISAKRNPAETTAASRLQVEAPPAHSSPELSFNLLKSLNPPLSERAATEKIVAERPQSAGSEVLPGVDNADAIFEGGSNSIVARVVGHAEGTRSLNGSKTRAYYGHVDPGNGVWNLGSFSYQHCDATCTPEEADDRQLRRLRRQSQVLTQRADSNGIQMTLEERLNGIDLANQAPLAALDQGGYVDWLRAAHQKGLTGSSAVLWARTYSFLNPKTQTWDAPGLGNRYDSITGDQERRRDAIASALEHHNQQRSQMAKSDLMPSTVAQLR